MARLVNLFYLLLFAHARAAPPHIVTTFREVSNKEPKEASLKCEVANFYPQTATIRWLRYNKESPGYVVLEKEPCTTRPIANSDGTFNIESRLTLYSEEVEDGSSYGCVVNHRDHEFVSNITVPEKETIGLIIGPVLVGVIILSSVMACVTRFKKVAPTLSDITGDDKLVHMCRTTLTCQVLNYRPEGLTVSVGLRSRGQQEAETITTCQTSSSTKKSQRNITDNADDRREDLPLQPEVRLETFKDKADICTCFCSISVLPNYDEDNGAELSVCVTHPALKSPISVQKILNIFGVAPRVTGIIAPAHQTHNENVTLFCAINGFKPRFLSITWLKRDSRRQITELIAWTPEAQQQHSEKYSHHVKEEERDISNHCFSSLTFRPTVKEDDGVTYICRTFHPGTQRLAEKELFMRLTAFPQLDEIQKKQEVIYIGEELNLSCRIHSFYPADISVTWYVDESPLPSEPSEPFQDLNTGLYHVISNVSYIPRELEWKTFRCEVQQETAVPRHVTWTLKDLSFRSQGI